MSNFSGLVKVSQERISNAVLNYEDRMEQVKREWKEYKDSLKGKNVSGWIFKKDDFDRLKEGLCAITGHLVRRDFGEQFALLDVECYHRRDMYSLTNYARSGEEEIFLCSSELSSLLWAEEL